MIGNDGQALRDDKAHGMCVDDIPDSRLACLKDNRIHGHDNPTEDALLIAQPRSGDALRFVPVEGVESGTFNLQGSETSESSLGASIIIELLDNLHYKKLMTGTQAAAYKNHYLKMCKLLLASRDNEFNLLQLAKTSSLELNKLDELIKKRDVFPEGYNTEADLLRKELLQAENEILCKEERYDELSYIMDGLREERKILQREFNRMPKEGEIDRLRQQLEQAIEHLREDIKKQSNDGKQLFQLLNEAHQTMAEEQTMVSATTAQVDELKEELGIVSTLPLKYTKEADRLRKQKEEAEKVLQESVVECSRMKEELEALTTCHLQLETESTKLGKQSVKKSKEIYEMQSHLDAVTLELDQAQKKHADCILAKTEAELQTKHLASTRSQLSDHLSRLTRDRDVAMQKDRKIQHALQPLRDAAKFAKHLLGERKAACVAMRQLGPDKDLITQRNDLLKAIEHLQKRAVEQYGVTEAERARLLRSNRNYQQLNVELADLRMEVLELTRLATIKAEEREQKAREHRLAKVRYAELHDAIKTKGLQIQEYEKSLCETQKHLKDFAQLYEAIKEERNNCLTLIKVAQQRMQEMNEKMRILNNEVDILRTALVNTLEQITRQRAKYKSVLGDRDAIRGALSKQTLCVDEQDAKRGELQRSIQCQSMLIENSKRNLEQLKNGIRHVIELRDNRVVQLVERNEELCVMREKMVLQQDAQRRGELQLNSIEEQIRCLEQVKRETEGTLEVLRREAVKHRQLEDDYTNQQIQLATLQECVAKLELAVIDPNGLTMDADTKKPLVVDPVTLGIPASNAKLTQQRRREVQIKDVDPAQLRLKLDSVEAQLLSREKKLLEYEMICKATENMIEKMRSQTEVDRDTTLQLALKMSESQTGFEKFSKQLKAKAAELTMLMELAHNLELEVQERRDEVALGQRRLKLGQPPTDLIGKEWERYLKHMSLKSEVYEDKINPRHCTNAAPQRPNAYIPHVETFNVIAEPECPEEDSDSGVTGGRISYPEPIPYGANAPFHPSRPGAGIRHFRKPKPIPLED
ncbi:unnamed protein product [Dicrocoelium dendriticum]|nr:unnamed protein product [Dicrocoelium dendriticum]